jgi:uncharacterized protein (DUF488 family)
MLIVKLYTIGYGGRSPHEFLSLLTNSEIKMVVDVRLRPDRAAMGIYALAKSPDKGIQKLLTDAGIRYCSLVELGNVFLAYENDWRERYARLLGQAGELLMDRLNQIAPPFCLMCAEKRHEDCHRQQIADYLATRQGYELEHL